MGGGGGLRSFSYRDYFNEVFPYCLAIGMTPEQFWEDDPALADSYVRAHDLIRQQRNQEMWLQGLYVYKAIQCFAPILVSFPKKGAKPEQYFDQPIPLTVKQAEGQKGNARKEKMMAYMQRQMIANNQRFPNGKSGENIVGRR